MRAVLQTAGVQLRKENIMKRELKIEIRMCFDITDVETRDITLIPEALCIELENSVMDAVLDPFSRSIMEAIETEITEIPGTGHRIHRRPIGRV